jgi:subtilase family serine protease
MNAPAPPVGDCSTSWGQQQATGLPANGGISPSAWAPCGYGPAQFRAAYAPGDPSLTGKGATVAITGWGGDEPTMESDLNTWSARRGIPGLTPGQLTIDKLGGGADGCGRPEQDPGEWMLDVEAVHGMAPDAKLLFVDACDGDLTAMLNHVVSKKLATIVSNSWGNSGDISLYHAQASILERGALEGIGFYFSTGDRGNPVAAGTEQPNPSDPYGGNGTGWPASSQYVTAVGGTTLAEGKDNTPLWETGWGDHRVRLAADGQSWSGPLPGELSGAGGGGQTLLDQPDYQAGVVPDSLAKPVGRGRVRTIPDVALNACSTTGLIRGMTQATSPGAKPAYFESVWGGTSLAAPLMAGLQALVWQKTGVSPGFANYVLYQQYQRNKQAFRDITGAPSGVQTPIRVARNLYRGDPTADGIYFYTLGDNPSLPATPGYDLSTGLGSPTTDYTDGQPSTPPSSQSWLRPALTDFRNE